MDNGRIPSGPGSRPTDRAQEVAAVPASIPCADTADYRQTFYAILNPYGQIWTPLIFESEEQAREHVTAFWSWDRAKREEFLRRCKIVPARAVISVASAIEARQRQDSGAGLIGEADESAVPEGETPND